MAWIQERLGDVTTAVLAAACLAVGAAVVNVVRLADRIEQVASSLESDLSYIDRRVDELLEAEHQAMEQQIRRLDVRVNYKRELKINDEKRIK